MKDRNARAEYDIFPPEGQGIGAIGSINSIDNAGEAGPPPTWADKYAGRLWIPDSEARGGYREWFVGRPVQVSRRRSRPAGFQPTPKGARR